MKTNTSDWKRVNLKDICERIDYGYTASAREEPVGPRFLRITDIVPSVIDWSGVPYCAIEESQREKYLLREGDIVIARTGATTGFAKLIKNHPFSVFASYLVRIRVRSGISSDYVGQVVQSFDYKKFIQKNLSGAAQPQANAQVLTSFPLYLPPAPIQNRIASILSAYDDLIESSTRRIKILEQMTQMIYREWFVNFRFPGHERVGLVKSELGLLPNGWSVATLSDTVSEIIDYRGKTPKKLGSDWSDNGVIALSALNVKQGRLENLDKAKRVDEDLYSRWMKSELAEGDILMTSEAPLGQLFMLTEKKKYCLSQRLFSIRAKPERILPSLLYMYLSSHAGQEQLTTRASGTTVLGIRQSELRKVSVPVPESSIQQKADGVIWPLLRQIELLNKRSENLRLTRDLLLPKLVSGEISVEHLESASAAQTV